MSRVAGVVLAAGSGTRMGEPKAEIILDGARLVDHAVLAVREAGCYPVYVVVRDGVAVVGARAVVNPEPERGMRSSLALAMEAVEEVDAVAVLLVDAPGIGASAIASVVQAWQPGRIAVGTYAGHRAHPTVMAPRLWREALTLAGSDEGARALLRARADLVDEIAVDGDPTDLDTRADLDRWRAARG